jgi:glyoxylase-like metal-dependent hydrolase (beta-lactamase superfamily II)
MFGIDKTCAAPLARMPGGDGGDMTIGTCVVAATLLARVAAEMGVPALEAAGFTQWSFVGTYDESVERGGFEPEPPAPVKDTFAVDLRGGGAGWDSEGLRGDGTVRARRFLYPAPDLLLRIEVPTRFAALTRSPAYRTEQLRAARAIPQMLLREALSRKDAVRPLPSVRREGATRRRLAYTTETADEIELLVDDRDRLASVELVRAVPFVGERRIAWEYGAWTRDRGVLVPRRLTITMGGEPLRVLALHAVVWDRAASVLTLPDGFPPPVERAGPAALAAAPLAPEARVIAPDVWLAPDVRPGINAFFIRQPDGVTVFEAPAGFLYPQIEIPPPDLARGRRASEPGEALVDLVRRTLPGVPIRRLVISHAHADHAGGVRAFAAEEAEIVVPQGAAEPVRRFLAERFSREPDRWERRRGSPRVREVADRESFGAGASRFDVVAVGENPHAQAMALLWLPEARLLLQGDLYYPEELADFPSPSRVPIMKWLAAWLARERLDPLAIWGTHSGLPATREHFQKLAGVAG